MECFRIFYHLQESMFSKDTMSKEYKENFIKFGVVFFSASTLFSLLFNNRKFRISLRFDILLPLATIIFWVLNFSKTKGDVAVNLPMLNQSLNIKGVLCIFKKVFRRAKNRFSSNSTIAISILNHGFPKARLFF